MVHRAPDARLLTNLIANEKDYAKHLASLFPFSHAALASLSAYAAASPASPARTIGAIVDLLASADDALQRYNQAIDTWREQLLGLKTLEDDLSAVLRDRDILVTRLIKASKATREAHRSSRLMSTLGSASLSSLPSTNSTTAHHSPSSTNPTTVTGAGSGPASTNARLAQAQAELQACEAHLVAKERELDARRISVARDGLGARCRALIDCGWVWGEMGKQGLRALQALSADGPPLHAGPKPSYPTYVSDSSSLTPSQSASQTAARSAETSHEGAASREQDRATSEGPGAHGDLTLTLPPAHAISEFTLPSVRSRILKNGDSVTRPHNCVVQNAKPVAPAPAPTSAPVSTAGERRKRSKRVHRPPSQFIVEVSDEGSDTGPFSAPSPAIMTTTAIVDNTNANGGGTDPSTSVLRTPFPVAGPNGTQDTSSDDEPTESLQVVENDPFEVIRQSMLSTTPSVPLLPVPPGTHEGLSGSEASPSNPVFSLEGRSPGSSARPGAKRERRTSMAFFGSLWGLFRKPKDRERLSTEWQAPPPKPSSANGQPNGHGRGWVTRTDARLGKGRKGGKGVDSDDDGFVARNAVKGNSGTRLRKDRPRGTDEGVGVDGWITDYPLPSGAVAGTRAGGGVGTSAAGTGLDRTKSRRGMVKRARTSVADLRGSEQGHTDGEVDGRAARSSTRASTKANGKEKSKGEAAEEVVDKGAPGKLARHVPASASNGVPGDTVDIQHRRAATTTAGSSRKLCELHRRSASLSAVESHVAVVSAPISASGTTTWEKPSAPSAPSALSTPASDTPMSTRSSIEVRTKKPKAKRGIGNGHATRGHVQNQSLMSIVADVTGQNRDWDSEDGEPGGTRSLDVPRAPGSVLREVGRDGGVESVDVGSGRGRGRRSSWTVGTGEGRILEHAQGQGRGRGVRMPLRSALRNPSRTPSPSPPVPPVSERKGNGGEKKGQASGLVEEHKRERAVSPSSIRDSMSVSSYATGRESLVGSGDEARPEPVLTIPPPPAVDPPVGKGEEGPLIRRKSVRVSLQPTFSPSPPALLDEDREGYMGRTDSAGGRGNNGVSDVWADSSSEEEVYQRGRALLSLVGGRQEVLKAKVSKDKRHNARR